MTHISTQWKHLVENIIQEAGIIPLFGTPPLFPWETFNQALQQKYETPDFSIQLSRIDWIDRALESEEPSEEKPLSIAFQLTPLPHIGFFTLSRETLRTVCMQLLSSHSDLKNAIHDVPFSFFHGFFLFLVAETLDALTTINAFPGLQCTLCKTESIPKDLLLSLELLMTCKGHHQFANILLPQPLLAAFREFFGSKGKLPIEQEIAKQTIVPISFVIGRSTIRISTWKKIAVGDFLILDQCTYRSAQKEGKASLWLHHKPLAVGSITLNSWQMLGEYYEETGMNIDDDTVEDEIPFEEPNKENNEGFVEENEQHSSDEQSEIEEEEIYNPSEEIKVHEDPLISREEVPLHICVELARISMPLDKVLSLSIGNVLDLTIPVGNNVTLTTSGKPIAKGELLQLGDVIGVKITEIG